MQTFLVPTDFSPEAKNAALYAAELAKVFGAKLFLYHAYMLPTPVSEVPYVMVAADDLQKENEGLIKKEAELLNETYGLEVEWLVQIGIPSDEIKALTLERSIDLVVMGMKGAGGIDKLVGSTTTNAIRKIKTPVLVVPSHAVFTPIKNITYASDFSYKTHVGLFEPLLKMTKTFNAKIHILNVSRTQQNEKTVSGKMGIETIFEDSDHEFVEITDDSIMHGINQYIQHHKSELLVMVEHKHSFFERVFSKDHTTAMAYQTKIPLLILQDKG